MTSVSKYQAPNHTQAHSSALMVGRRFIVTGSRGQAAGRRVKRTCTKLTAYIEAELQNIGVISRVIA